jgi:5-methylcytosine-specific restriction endonuclease McrA
MNRPCLDCGVLIGAGSRCRPCGLNRRRATYDNQRWRRLREQTRAAQPSCVCRNADCPHAPDVCGATTDLTTDHVRPASKGGQATPQNVQTHCRPCNSRKGNR